MSDPPYTIDHGSNSRRKAVEEWLFGPDLVTPDRREKIVTAWVSIWTSSPYADLSEMPYSPAAPRYRLEWHVNEVTRHGLDLAKRAASDWGKTVDTNILVPILILHDVDKPLVYVRESADQVAYSKLSRELQHGVVGAMLLKELGFDHTIISTVALHAGNSPFMAATMRPMCCTTPTTSPPTTRSCWKARDKEPYYQKHWRQTPIVWPGTSPGEQACACGHPFQPDRLPSR